MSAERERIVQGLAEADSLLCSNGEGEFWPKAWATLSIDLRLLTDEQRQKVWQATSLLKEAGIQFDTGVGSGELDWELDWSLRGAHLKVRPLYCCLRGCPNTRWGERGKDQPGMAVAYWIVTRRRTDSYVSSWCYCSEACMATAERAAEDQGDEIVLRDQAVAWEVAQ